KSFTTSPVARARPPSEPRVAMLRMKTPASSAWACMRMRSPSTAPPVNGLEGSTAMMPTVCSSARSSAVRRSTTVDLPAPGGPVTPITYACRARACTACMMAGTAAVRFSTWVMRRASARRSPLSMRSTSAAGSDLRGVDSDPAIEVERPDSNTGRTGPRLPARSGLADEHEVGRHLDVVGDLEEQQLRDAHAVVGEGRAELRLHLQVVGRESEALLLLDLLRRKLDVRHGAIGDGVDGPVLDGQHAVDPARRLPPRLERLG